MQDETRNILDCECVTNLIYVYLPKAELIAKYFGRNVVKVIITNSSPSSVVQNF